MIVARLYVGIYNQVGISVQGRIAVAKLAYHTRKVGPLYFKTAVLCFSLAEFEYGVDQFEKTQRRPVYKRYFAALLGRHRRVAFQIFQRPYDKCERRA